MSLPGPPPLLFLKLTLVVSCFFLPREGYSGTDARHDLVYIAGGVVGAFPEDHDVVFQGVSRSPSIVRAGVGLAVKAAVFPAMTRNVVGLELESMGHSGRIQFPISSGGATQTGSSALTVFTTMANLLVQYPGSRLTPYAGVGLGWATGALTGTNIPGRPDRELEASSALSYQFLAGIRAHMNEHVFLFTEYKRLTTTFHWTQLALDFKANYALVGLGYSF